MDGVFQMGPNILGMLTITFGGGVAQGLRARFRMKLASSPRGCCVSHYKSDSKWFGNATQRC